MNPLPIFALGICIGVLATTAGALLGSWLGFRARNNQSPIPSISLPSINIFRRKRTLAKPETTHRTPFKPVRA